MLRLPCLATLTPQAAATNAAVVLMLKVPDLSPPVPQLSSNGPAGICEATALSSNDRAAPTSSSALGPLTLRNERNDATSPSDQSPVRIPDTALYACDSSSDFPS